MAQTTKPIIYSSTICGLALLWHLVWVINWGSSEGVSGIITNAMESLEDRNSWFRSHWLFYFVLFPLAIFIVTLIFAWSERSSRRKHRIGFLAVTLVALSPVICAAVLILYAMAML